MGRGAPLREHPRQPLLQDAAALHGPGAPGRRRGGPRWVPPPPPGAFPSGGSSSPNAPESTLLLTVSPEGVTPPASQLGPPAPHRPSRAVGAGASAGGVGLAGLTGGRGCFQGPAPPATHRSTSRPPRRPTGRGPSTRRPGRSGCPSWSRGGRGPRGEDGSAQSRPPSCGRRARARGGARHLCRIPGGLGSVTAVSWPRPHALPAPAVTGAQTQPP